MEDQNIIIFLDKIKKLIELGNTPKAADEIDTLIMELERHIRKRRGMVIVPLIIPGTDEMSKPMQFARDNSQKINEIIQFINKRFSG